MRGRWWSVAEGHSSVTPFCTSIENERDLARSGKNWALGLGLCILHPDCILTVRSQLYGRLHIIIGARAVYSVCIAIAEGHGVRRCSLAAVRSDRAGDACGARQHCCAHAPPLLVQAAAYSPSPPAAGNLRAVRLRGPSSGSRGALTCMQALRVQTPDGARFLHLELQQVSSAAGERLTGGVLNAQVLVPLLFPQVHPAAQIQYGSSQLPHLAAVTTSADSHSAHALCRAKSRN